MPSEGACLGPEKNSGVLRQSALNRNYGVTSVSHNAPRRLSNHVED